MSGKGWQGVDLADVSLEELGLTSSFAWRSENVVNMVVVLLSTLHGDDPVCVGFT